MPPKKTKRGAPWAAINARKQQIEQARAHKERQALRAAAEAARNGVLNPGSEVQRPPMAPPPTPMDWQDGPASGTRGNRKGIHMFATTEGAMYGVGDDKESARADVTAQHEQLQAEAAAVALQKLSQDDSYNNPPPEIVAAMDRQRKRQGGVFTPVSFLPSATQDANGMAHPGTPYVLSTPPLRNTSSTMGSSFSSSDAGEQRILPSPGRSRLPIHQPVFRGMTPPTDENARPEPSTPRAKYYTNPHHGPSRYGGWFEHVRPIPNDPEPSTPQRVLEPPRQTVWPQLKLRRPGSSSEHEPLLTPTKKSKHAPTEDDDDGSEWCAAPVPRMNQGNETDVEKRVVAHVDLVRTQPDPVLLSHLPFTPNASSSTKTKRLITNDMTKKHDNETSVEKHRSSVFACSDNGFANDIIYARELFSGSVMDDYV